MKFNYSLLFLWVILSFSSCVSYESLLNYDETPNGGPLPAQTISNFEPIKIKPNDILRIKVISNDAALIKPFTLASEGEVSETADLNNYMVDSKGRIDFPTLGSILVKGQAIEEVKSTILALLSPYFETNPILQVSLVNFKVNVNGEVGKPGVFFINNDRVTVLEAVIMAGDLTIYSRRDSVMIIREEEGVRSFGYVNFNSPEVFNSPYFYLQQNDVVYVRPAKRKVNSIRGASSRFLPWVSTLVSVAALVITIVR